MTDALIQLSGITKDYGGMLALQDVDLDIPPGITGLLGPNGAGKSTLIKILLGLVRPTRGSGTVLGIPIGRRGQEIRSRIGFVPEDDCYIPGMTGVEVVRFAASLSGFQPVEGLRRAHEILDFCGMKQERYRNIESFSTGMRQKIKFAAAIVHDPEYLILDEPTSGLDPEERESLLHRIRLLADKKGKSVLLSTHILPDVQQICDHVVILSRGRKRMSESLENLNRPSNQTYTLSILGDGAEFCEALTQRGLRAVVDLAGQIKLDVAEGDVASAVWDVARRQGVSVQSLRPARNSLEEIFISAVQEAEHATA